MSCKVGLWRLASSEPTLLYPDPPLCPSLVLAFNTTLCLHSAYSSGTGLASSLVLLASSWTLASSVPSTLMPTRGSLEGRWMYLGSHLVLHHAYSRRQGAGSAARKNVCSETSRDANHCDFSVIITLFHFITTWGEIITIFCENQMSAS